IKLSNESIIVAGYISDEFGDTSCTLVNPIQGHWDGLVFKLCFSPLCNSALSNDPIQNGHSESIRIYPNPSNGKFYFNTPAVGSEILTIYSLTGNQIKKLNVPYPEKGLEID